MIILVRTHTGTVFDSFRVGGQMDLLISLSVQFKPAKVMFTTSPLLGKEELSFGMPTFHGSELLSMDLSLSSLSTMNLTLLSNPTRKFQFCSV